VRLDCVKLLKMFEVKLKFSKLPLITNVELSIDPEGGSDVF